MKYFATLLTILGALTFGGHCAAQPDTVRFQVVLTPGQAQVAIDFPANYTDSVIVELSRWAGVNDFAKNVRQLRAVSANMALPLEQINRSQWLVRNTTKAFRLQYVIANEKGSFTGDAGNDHFHPTVLSDWAFLWGHSFLIVPANTRLMELPATVEISGDEYGLVVSTLVVDSAYDRPRDLLESLTIAGEFRRYRFPVADGEAQVYIQGDDWSFEDSAFASAAEKIVRSQADRFGYYPEDRLMLVLTEGTDNSLGGTAIDRALAVFADPGEPLQSTDMQLLHLIAHEHFHLWLGRDLMPSSERGEGYLKWFTEGVTDYYAWLTLLEVGYLDVDRFAGVINKTIIEYYRNPYAFTATADTLAEKFWVSRSYNRLPYAKGLLAALLVDLRLRSVAGKALSLDTVLSSMLQEYDNKEGGFSGSDIVSTLVSLGDSSWQDYYSRYLIGADSLPLAEGMRRAGATVEYKTVDLFDLGFQTESGAFHDSVRVSRVRAGSRAAEAGLRVGDRLTSWSFTDNELDEPARFRLIRGDSAIDLQYLPVRRAIVPQLVTTEATLHTARELLGSWR